MNKRMLLPPEAPTNRLRLIMKKGVFSHLSRIPPFPGLPTICRLSVPFHPTLFPRKKEKEKKRRTGNRYIPARPHPTPSPSYSTCAPFLLAVPCSRRRDRASVFLYPTSSSTLHRLGGPFLTMLKGGIRQLIMCIVLEGRSEWRDT